MPEKEGAMNAGEWTTRWGALHPDEPSVKCGGVSFTKKEFNSRINQAGHALQARGIKPGDRVSGLPANGKAERSGSHPREYRVEYRERRSVEDVICQMPQVKEVGVIGFQDPKWGEVGMAVVAPKAGITLTEQDVIGFCQGKLARYKIPKKGVCADALPRTGTGKVLKKVLREKYLEKAP
jgi:acyl-CoA synthetase (AMP-forming)/AMP-acid ligase II